MAHTSDSQNPVMTVALGTSLGFATSDKRGNIVRALDGMNLDLGEMPIATSASEKKVWWALGSRGLAELQAQRGNEPGAAQFGYRLGAFLASMCGVFRPKTIVLSGGITERWWDAFHSTMEHEFRTTKPTWCGDVKLLRSPHGGNAALAGIARYALRPLSM